MILNNLIKNIVFSFGKVVNYGNEITHSFIQKGRVLRQLVFLRLP